MPLPIPTLPTSLPLPDPTLSFLRTVRVYSLVVLWGAGRGEEFAPGTSPIRAAQQGFGKEASEEGGRLYR